MRIKIQLTGQRNIVLPIGFNAIIQWFIYSSIKDSWLHDIGFVYDKRKFKIFSFSSFLEKAEFINEKKLFIFPQTISFIVSSPVNWILEHLASGGFATQKVNLWHNEVYLSEISVLRPIEFISETIDVEALTPIEVHSTFETHNSKKTYYYNPYEKEFPVLISKNATKKWEAFYKKPPPSTLNIEPIGFNKEKIVRFGLQDRYIIVKGWRGKFRLTGNIKLLEFIVEAGLGDRNSQGFGMVEVLKQN